MYIYKLRVKSHSHIAHQFQSIVINNITHKR